MGVAGTETSSASLGGGPKKRGAELSTCSASSSSSSSSAASGYRQTPVRCPSQISLSSSSPSGVEEGTRRFRHEGWQARLSAPLSWRAVSGSRYLRLIIESIFSFPFFSSSLFDLPSLGSDLALPPSDLTWVCDPPISARRPWYNVLRSSLRRAAMSTVLRSTDPSAHGRRGCGGGRWTSGPKAEIRRASNVVASTVVGITSSTAPSTLEPPVELAFLREDLGLKIEPRLYRLDRFSIPSSWGTFVPVRLYDVDPSPSSSVS